MSALLYSEKQSTYPVLFAIFIIELLFIVGLAVYGFTHQEFEVTVVSLFSTVIFSWIFVSFLWMHLEVYPGKLVARYGFFRKVIYFEDIKSITVEPYHFWKYGGWGIRWNWKYHSTAWVTRSGVGVQIDLGGRNCFISAKQPQRIVDLVNERR